LKRLIYCIFLVLLSSAEVYGATLPALEIQVSKPVFVLPQFTGPYSDREASIAPDEYETAERLRTMLDNGQSAEVLKELEAFYDIELSPAMLTLKAQIYFSLKMYDKAEATFLAVLARKPQLIRVHSDLAQLYLIREDYPKARKYFANAVAFGANEAIIHGQLAYLNLTMYGAYSAISEYQQAMALEPDSVQWQQGLLAALTQAKMFEAAQALVKELLAKRPNDSNLWLNQAALALQQNDSELALVSIEMAILLGDNDRRNLTTAAQLHLQLNSYERALALLKQSLQQGNIEMASINEYLAWFAHLEMWDQARQLLDNVAGSLGSMSLDDQSQYYLHRAVVEQHQKNISKAISLFKQSLDKNPTNGDALLAFAKFSSLHKDYVEAEMLYVRAEAVDGAERKAMLGRAQLYIDMQDYPAALKHLVTAYQKYPDMVELKNNIEIIENIIRAKNSRDI
jgi:tetratricopeptide (TPR) repeat protein